LTSFAVLKRFALCASHFSLNGKEALLNSRMAGQSNQKKAARRSARRKNAACSQVRREFPEGTSMCRPETPHILCVALRVYPPRLPDLTGSKGQKQRKI
jgi:electron transfer flavoprotein alpha/beta subunit